MTLRDVAELAWQRFRTRGLRFFLTVLGVSVGIAVVFFLVSLGFGLQEIVIGRIVTSESLVSLDVVPSQEAESVVPITEERVEEFRRIERVQDVSPLLAVPAEITYGELRAQSLAHAVRPTYFRYAGMETVQGRFYDDAAVGEVVVTNTVLRLFEIPEDAALGEDVRLTFFFRRESGIGVEALAAEGEEEAAATPPLVLESPEGEAESAVNIVTIPIPFRIVGVVRADTNSIFVPLKTLARLSNLVYDQAKVRVGTTEDIDPVRSELARRGYTVRALTDTLEQLNKIFRFTQAALASLGIIALFIASVGMFNTMTISLLERTREVGTLKTIGATNRDVWMIFLFEAILIGALGGVGGLLLGFGLTRIVNVGVGILASQFGGEGAELFSSPLWFVVAIFSVAIVVGLFTGLYPARRAARLNPLHALRHE